MHAYPSPPILPGKVGSINSFYDIHKLSLCSTAYRFSLCSLTIYKFSLCLSFFGAIQKNIELCNYLNKFNKYFAWLWCIQNFFDICKFLPYYLNLFELF